MENYVRSRGFTLLELLVVMVIAALTLAVVLPRLPGVVEDVEVRTAARDLTSALRYARNLAMTKQHETTVQLDLTRRFFTVDGTARKRSLPAKADIRLVTARTEQVSAERGFIRFFPDGSSTGGQITLKRADRKYVVDVDWLTGRVAIFQ